MAIVNRIVRFGFEQENNIRWYDTGASQYNNQLAITAQGSKYISSVQANATVTIFNLNNDIRNYISRNLPIWNVGRQLNTPVQLKRFILQIGRVDKPTQFITIYSGYIITAQSSNPPDISFTFTCNSATFLSYKIISIDVQNQSYGTIASLAAKALGKTLNMPYNYGDIYSSRFIYTGDGSGFIDRFRALGFDVFVDNDLLNVFPQKNNFLGNRIRVINSRTGLIGTPNNATPFVEVSVLMDVNVINLYDLFKVESYYNDTLNGTYRCLGIEFNLSSRETAFYWKYRGGRTNI